MDQRQEFLNLDLCVATIRGDDARVRSLLEQGADRSALTPYLKVALDEAERLHHVNAIKYLYKDLDLRDEVWNVIFDALQNDRTVVIQALMELGLRERLTGRDSYLVLFTWSCWLGTPRTIECLYHHGPPYQIAPHIRPLVRVAAEADARGNAAKLVELASLETVGRGDVAAYREIGVALMEYLIELTIPGIFDPGDEDPDADESGDEEPSNIDTDRFFPSLDEFGPADQDQDGDRV